jgi:hypothetical protein
MALNIIYGKKKRPQKVVIYAPEGIGKSTLASQLPSPIFFDFEGGTDHLDVARLKPDTLADFEKWARELIKDRQGFQTVVIDTVDWLEESAIKAVVAGADNDAVKSIEDLGWGKGWIHLIEKMNHVTSIFDRLVDAGLHVVCLAHCAVRRFDDPKLVSGYDRYELKMYKDRANSKGTAALLKEWSDALLFGTFEDKVKMSGPTGERGRAVAGSGRERVLFCTHSAAWDAKNRHGLKDKEPWSVETLMRVLGNPTLPAKAAAPASGVKPSTTAAPKPVKDIKRVVLADETPVQSTPEAERIKARAVAKQEAAEEPGGQPVAVEEESGGQPVAVEESGGQPVTGEDAGDAVVFVQPLPTSDDPIPGIEEHEEPDEELSRICGPHAAAVNAYLRDKQKVGPHQSFLSVAPAYRKMILANPSGFLDRVKAYVAEGGAA